MIKSNIEKIRSVIASIREENGNRCHISSNGDITAFLGKFSYSVCDPYIFAGAVNIASLLNHHTCLNQAWIQYARERRLREEEV